MRTLVAVDPGKCTGWAIRYATGHRDAGQVEGSVHFMDWAESLMSTSVGSAGGLLVVENFIPRGGALTAQPDALHIIGYLLGRSRQLGWGMVLQTPGEAKGFSTNEKLKRAGWWVVGADHARDALRHLMYYMTQVERDANLLRAVAP